MSDFFSDHTYEDLDWLSKTVEPYTWSLNDKLSTIPDEIILTYGDIISAVPPLYGQVQISAIIQKIATDRGADFSDRETRILTELFKLEVPEATEINYKDKTLSNPIKLLKTVTQIPDEKIPKLLVQEARITLQYGLFNTYETMTRVTELLELVGLGIHPSPGRSRYAKTSMLATRLQEIIAGDEWRIRNVDLMLKVMEWMKSYVNNNELNSLVNLTKLKVMVHNKQPIYSLIEVE